MRYYSKEEFEQSMSNIMDSVAVERERHSAAFPHDLAAAANTYLKKRAQGFTLDNIEQSLKSPSQKVNAAQIFFASKIFPELLKLGKRNNDIADTLIALFLHEMTRTMLMAHAHKIKKEIHAP